MNLIKLFMLLTDYYVSLKFQTRGNISISEGAIIGTRKLLESATIPGGIQNINVPLNIIDGNEGSYFQLHVTKSQDGQRVSYIHLETRKKLDRESTSQFNLNITNGLGYLDLGVNILDINDNPPVFQRSSYKISVNESVPIGSSLITVTANDADEGKNAILDYSIANEAMKSIFQIDSSLGLVSVKSSLKCDQSADCPPCLMEDKSCSVVILATDRGQPRQSAQTVVKISLLDTNDHDPIITFKVLPNQSQSFASVNELAKAGTSVAAITVSDEDKGPHGQTDLEIIGGNAKGHFSLQSYGGGLHVLRVSSRARFFRGTEYELVLKAKDHGIPTRSSTASLLVKVNEVNEHKPTFDQKHYDIEISESLPSGSSIMILSAQDDDANANLSYEIAQPLVSRFKIHKKSGLVTTTQFLDRETEESTVLKIRVTDGSHEDFATVMIKITDINDEKPTFEEPKYSFDVNENFPLRQTFAQVKAFDRDLGENGRVSYYLGGKQNDFEINKVTGEISAITSLDREARSEYFLTIVAYDNGLNVQQSSSVEVEIHVQDVNDNSPKLYPKAYYLALSSVESTYLKATDLDENEELSFQLEDPVPEFDLDVESGLFTTNSRYKSLIKSEGRVRIVKAVALDKEGQSSENKAEIYVYPVNQLTNEVFEENFFEFEIQEDSQLSQTTYIGRFIGNVDIRRSDVELDIIDGDSEGVFEIIVDGSIQTAKNIDRELKQFYNLTVVAKNDLGYDTAFVSIKITDLNDNVPEFRDESVALEVDFRAPIGHEIHQVKCFDPDAELGGTLEFMLDSGANNPMAIDPHTGVIYLKSRLQSKANFDITVKVNDLGNPSLSNVKNYVIKVTGDVNYFTPMFDFHLYEISLSEMTPLNSEVITMSAVDEDLNDEISYAIIDNNNENTFDILPDGKVLLVDKLDREAKAYYSVIVTATDNGLVPFARSSTSTLVIYVTDDNDNAPILDKTEYIFQLRENSPAGTVIGRISAHDLDLGRNAEITYKLASPNDLFEVNKQSGFITSKTGIDRESLPSSSFDLAVVVSDLGLVPKSTTANLIIEIIDENDNPPKFSQNAYQASISEGASLGAEIIQVIAKDSDEGVNGQVEYQIINDDSGTFQADSSTGKIYLRSGLDREAIGYYSIMVEASDKGIPSLTSTCLVHLEVLDENDHTPEFLQEKVKLELPEDSEIGLSVHKFKAFDRDIGDNGKIKYFLVGNNLNGLDIESESGMLTITSQLDREIRDRIDFVVSAVDGGVYANTGSVTVSIDITDVNDNAPVIHTTTSVISVKEGIAPGTKLTKIEASDADIGSNGDIRFRIKNNIDKFFDIDTKSGDLFSTAEIDYETKNSYKVIIEVADQGVPHSLSVEKTFDIKVEDINDNAPVITSLNTALIKLDEFRGSVLMTVHAEDKDSGSNAAISYRLQQLSPLVSIDSISGKVSLIQDYQRQLDEPLTLTVIASDGAVPSARKSSTATLTFIEGRPLPGLSFATDLYEATLKENEPLETLVLSASLNGNPQEKVEYYIIGCESEKGQERGLFTIDKFTGEMKTNQIIDRETEGSTILVQIIALIGSDKMSQTKAKILLEDENDSEPIFSPDFDLTLSESYLPGHKLGFAQATDADLNAILTYSLGLTSQNFLKIDAQSGELSLTSSIDRETTPQLEVVILATDGRFTSEWRKIIPVEDVNDNAPSFFAPQFSFDIMENVERGAFVGKIQAEDLDENEKITYSFISNWGLDTFSVDPSSGVISLSSNSLDHETTEHYILTVSAADSGNPVLTATSTVYVNVLDVNDNPPLIDKSLYEVIVREDAPTGFPIVNIVASDLDSEANTDLQFSLRGTYSDVFDILSNGTIVTKSRLDREANDFYTFEVTVADSTDTQSQLTSNCIVQVTVEDANDQVPNFEDVGRLEILENSPPNTKVMAIRASDGDLGRNAEIEYLLEDSLGGKFSIGRIDGVLRAVQSLDREEEEEYKLSVTAIDHGTPRYVIYSLDD